MLSLQLTFKILLQWNHHAAHGKRNLSVVWIRLCVPLQPAWKRWITYSKCHYSKPPLCSPTHGHGRAPWVSVFQDHWEIHGFKCCWSSTQGLMRAFPWSEFLPKCMTWIALIVAERLVPNLIKYLKNNKQQSNSVAYATSRFILQGESFGLTQEQ